MAILQLLTIFAATLVTVIVIKYHWSRRKLYKFAGTLPSPWALPLIGHGYLFACKNEEIFDRIEVLISKYKSPFKLWLGPKLIIIFKNLEHVEKILSSKKITHKSEIYRFMGEFAARGLITASGPDWKHDRKIIQPHINAKFVNGSVEVMQRHATVLINNMTELVDKGIVDVCDVMHRFCFDVIGELVCGMHNNTQLGENEEIMHHFSNMYDNAFGQMVKPWLHVKFLFDMTPYRIERDRLIDGIYKYMYKAIDNATERVNKLAPSDTLEEPILDQLVATLQNNPSIMDKRVLAEHMFTLYIASEDTINITAAMACVCFGMYPEYQKKAVDEIHEIFGDQPREVTYSDVVRLKYLEMCIKDILRLATIAPYILRKCTEDIQIGEFLVPAGCEVLIPIFDIHRDPKQWSNPEHFYPDHFLPEAVERRNIYSYLPFSIGPRGCIGKHLAILSIKVLLANVLQHFRFEADGKFPDIRFRSDISVRPIDGYKVRIYKRQLTQTN